MLRRTEAGRSLRKRLLPLYLATALLGTWLWVPVEKLFMNEIGFNPATVGVMAAVYAAVPPILEVPSGILADRWSRRGVLIVSSVAASLSALVGGISTSVPTYFVSAFFLGVFLAMRSGTLEAVLYDTVLEETGDSEGFEKRVGRVRLIDSVALVASALAGGLLAGLTTPRLMYFLTVPFTVLSIVAFLRFEEPRLHQSGESTSLRSHIALTFHAVTRRRQLGSIVGLAVLTSLILTVIFEFGPMWLVTLAVSAAAYGPHWAGLMATLGVGGLLAGRIQLDRPATLGGVTALMIVASVALTTSRDVVAVTVAQVVLALLVVTASIHVTRLLHDAVPSTVRAGVASGVGAISWITFLPFALLFGMISNDHGVHVAAWMIVGITVLASILLAKATVGSRALTATGPATLPDSAPPVQLARSVLTEAA